MRALIDLVSQQTRSDFTFSLTLLSFLVSTMPERLMDLPVSSWETCFAIDYQAPSPDSKFIDKVRCLPPLAIFFISQALHHKNGSLFTILLNSIYSHDLTLILNTETKCLMLTSGKKTYTSQVEEQDIETYSQLLAKQFPNIELTHSLELKKSDSLSTRMETDTEKAVDKEIIKSPSSKRKTLSPSTTAPHTTLFSSQNLEPEPLDNRPAKTQRTNSPSSSSSSSSSSSFSLTND